MRGTFLVAAVAVAALAFPPQAGAHAAFVSSRPEPGERLSTAPGAVVLRFSEPLIPRLSGATVADPGGKPSRSPQIGEREIRVPLDTTAPGVYTVEWKTVSPLDGHTLRGSFRFGVGTSPGAEGAGTDVSPRGSDLALAPARALEYAGLLTAAGMLLLAVLARRGRRLGWVQPRLPLAFGAALVGGVAVVGGEALSAGDAVVYLTSSTPGLARLVRVVGVGLGLLAALVGSPSAAAVALAGSVMALAAAGHAAAVPPAWWGVGVNTVHLLSAGLWAGGILALSTLRPPDGWRGGEGRELLDRFTPVALNAFAVTVGTGILRATQELSVPGDLVASSYGRVLGLKVLAVAAMVPLSVRAWRRVGGSVRGEATLAVVVVTAAAVLAAYPLPPQRAAEAEEGPAEPSRAVSALPDPGELTLGGDAGETLVGLTLRPGEPGPNDAFVFLLPARGPSGEEDLEVEIGVGDRTVGTERCGSGCRVAPLELRGGETLRLRVDGPGGGTARFEVPPLPAPPGRDVLERATARMQGLDALRVMETLSPPRPPIRNVYGYRAPDRMHLRSSTGFEVIAVGTAQYRRSGGEPWDVSRDAPRLDVPLLAWEGFEPVTVREVGRDRVEGTGTRVVSLFTGDRENPIWFRLWVDPDGLVRLLEMRAEAHFMDHRFSDFDGPVRIEPPEVG